VKNGFAKAVPKQNTREMLIGSVLVLLLVLVLEFRTMPERFFGRVGKFELVRENRLKPQLCSRTGVPPVSEIQEASVLETTVAAVTHYQLAGKIRKDGDRRDACPTCLTARAVQSLTV